MPRARTGCSSLRPAARSSARTQPRRREPSPRGALRVLATAVLLAAGPGSAGMTPDHQYALLGAEGVFHNDKNSVLVVTVTQVGEGPFTNGNPPSGVVEVSEVLRGSTAVGAALKATWRPFPHDVDYGDREKNPRVIAWKKTPMPAPQAGEKLLVVGEVKDSAISIAPRSAFPFSDEKRKWALEVLARVYGRPSKSRSK